MNRALDTGAREGLVIKIGNFLATKERNNAIAARPTEAFLLY